MREIAKKKLDIFKEMGWQHISTSGSVCKVRKRLTKWERFEVRTRGFFESAGFEHTIEPMDFHYDALGYQIDVCGGVGDHFVIMDCTSKNEPGHKSLKEKVKDALFKKRNLENSVLKEFKGRYKRVHMVVCTEDIDQDLEEIADAQDKGVRIIDKSILEQWFPVAEVLGSGLKFQVLETLLGARVEIEEAGGKQFKFKGLRIQVQPESGGTEGSRYLYVFAVDPDTMLKLAVVYRLKYQDPRGYQRDLKPKKLRSINEFLSDSTKYFPNSLLVAFDEDGTRKLGWEGHKSNDPQVETGDVLIPPYHCIAEVIDGQHRLYGYLDFNNPTRFEKQLRQRRSDDRLVVVAIPDPAQTERPALYLAINSTQTKISTREIWALMAEARPTTEIGYVANMIKRLNEKGVFENSIEIPKLTRGRRSINIANFGKGMIDRHLFDQAGEAVAWNLWFKERGIEPYPVSPDEKAIETVDEFFSAVTDCHRADWGNRVSFLCSNNGVNVMLRVFVEVLKYYQTSTPTHQRMVGLLKPVLKKYIQGIGGEDLLGLTSSEVGREKHATAIIQRINRINSEFAREYLRKKKLLK